MQVPDRTEYPDYYAMIKKPIDLEQIKAKLEARAYTSLLEVNVDFNQVFVNAKRFNAPGSSIFLDAKKLHVRFLLSQFNSTLSILVKKYTSDR